MDLVGHLLGQFTGRTEDEGLDGLAGGVDLLDRGNGEGGGLSGASLGLAHQITPGKEYGDRGGLNRGGLFESELGHGLENFRRETQAVEALFFHKMRSLRREERRVTLVRRQ